MWTGGFDDDDDDDADDADDADDGSDDNDDDDDGKFYPIFAACAFKMRR